jgi:hypothetical protein
MSTFESTKMTVNWPFASAAQYALGNYVELQSDASAPKVYEGGEVVGQLAMGDIYVSTVNGDDANDGTFGNPIKSFTRLKEIATQNRNIYLERGSVWDSDVEESGGKVIESLTQTTVEVGDNCIISDSTLSTCKISSYGAGAKPKVNARITVPQSAISLDIGTTYTYVIDGAFSFDLHPFGGGIDSSCYPHVKIENKNLIRVVDKATVDSTAGTYYVTAVGTVWTYYVHGFDSEDLSAKDILTPFKTYGALDFNESTFAEIDGIVFEGACSKNGNVFYNGIVSNCVMYDNAVHHALYGLNASIKDIVHLSDSEWTFEGIEMFSRSYSDTVSLDGFVVDYLNAIGGSEVFTHSTNDGGFKNVALKNLAQNGIAPQYIQATDALNLAISDSKLAPSAKTNFIEKKILISNFANGAVDTSVGKIDIFNVKRFAPVNDARVFGACISIDRKHLIHIKNSFLDYIAVSPVSGVTTLTGTEFLLENSTYFIDDEPSIMRKGGMAVAQDILLTCKNSVVARPRMKKDFIYYWSDTYGYSLINKDDLPTSSTWDLVAENTTFEKVLFFKGDGSGLLKTLAELQAEFPNVKSDCRYGQLAYLFTDTPATTLGDLIGDDSTWSTDPDNIANYLITLQSFSNEFYMKKNNPFMVRIGGSRIIALDTDDTNAERLKWTYTNTTAVGQATTFDDFYSFMKNGNMTISIPKIEIADTDSVEFQYVTWNYDGNYVSSDIVGNDYVEANYNLIANRGHNEDKKQITDFGL